MSQWHWAGNRVIIYDDSSRAGNKIAINTLFTCNTDDLNNLISGAVSVINDLV